MFLQKNEYAFQSELDCITRGSDFIRVFFFYKPAKSLLEKFMTSRQLYPLREKCPNAEFFLVRIFLYLVRIQKIRTRKKLRIWTLFTQWPYLVKYIYWWAPYTLCQESPSVNFTKGYHLVAILNSVGIWWLVTDFWIP